VQREEEGKKTPMRDWQKTKDFNHNHNSNFKVCDETFS